MIVSSPSLETPFSTYALPPEGVVVLSREISTNRPSSPSALVLELRRLAGRESALGLLFHLYGYFHRASGRRGLFVGIGEGPVQASHYDVGAAGRDVNARACIALGKTMFRR